MRTRTRAAAAALLLLAVVVGTTASAFAAAPPYEPDSNSLGGLTFYDASGNVITGGSVTAAPFAAYVQAGGAGRAGDTKATLYGYLPKNGVATGAWSGEQLSSSTTYPNASAPAALAGSTLPLVTGSVSDITLASLESAYPNTATDAYQGLYQLRVKTSGPGQAAGSTYYSADILISGTSWTQVYPAPTTAATTTQLGVTPASPQPGGTQLTLTATVTPSTAPGSVQFYDGATAIGSPAIVSGGTAQIADSGLTVATHQLSAQFTPANPASNPTEFGPSTSNTVSYVVTVPPATPTTTTLAVNTGTGVGFSPVQFTATVTPSSAPGTVTFSDGSTVLGTSAAGSGTFTLTTSSLGNGSHSVTATFTPTTPASYSPSTSTASSFSLSAPLVAPASGSIKAEIPAGTLVLSTPYTPGSPLDLGALALNTGGTEYSGSAPFTGLSVTDARAGDLPWTLNALSSALTGPGTATISAENVGLTGVVAVPVAGNALTAANVATFDNPVPAVAVGPTDAGGAGLGGGTPHKVASAAQGEGSISFNGTLTIEAPSSSGPGTYTGTITFTIG